MNNGPRALASPASVAGSLAWAAGLLGDSGCRTPRLDAEVLLAHVLRADRCFLIRESSHEIAPAELDAFGTLVRRRAAREPVAYLTGSKEFWSRVVKVDSRALIPRPESETLIEEALELYAASEPRTFADIGCGSGCLAIALGGVFSGARGIACDISAEALALARHNIEQADLTGRIETRRGSLLEPLGEDRVELICANLPYVPTGELAALDPGVRDYEPAMALDGGSDGLELVGRLIDRASDSLAAGGWLILEIGAGQYAEVAERCRRAGLKDMHCRRDLQGFERVAAARREDNPCRN